MTAEGYKTFINGSVMASFMEGIVASILEEKVVPDTARIVAN